jgi:hypothetical protein
VIEELAREKMAPFSPEEEARLRQEAEWAREQITELQRAGWRVVLFRVPGEPQIDTSVQQRHVQALLREVFPADQFEWLPEMQPRAWLTTDGVHLIRADAQVFAEYLRNQLLN